MVQRSKKHVWVGLGFVVTAIAIAAAVYFGIKLMKSDGPTGQPSSSAQQGQDAASDPATDAAVESQPTVDSTFVAKAREQIEGFNFSDELADNGVCSGDYIYTFGAISENDTGEFSGTNPTADSHSATMYGTFRIEDRAIIFANLEMRGADGQVVAAPKQGGENRQPLTLLGKGKVSFGDLTLQQCAGAG